MVKHPAKYTDNLLPIFETVLKSYGCRSVLDPFAGTGKIHLLPFDTVGVEIEPEWASMNEKTVCGDATSLPFGNESFDAVCTSPTYGNRMADNHNAKDSSRRLTYTHILGRKLHPNNSGKMQWGNRYRLFHQEAWSETKRVLRGQGIFILNISDHIRKGVVQPVTQFHIETITSMGFVLSEHIKVDTPRMKFGQNNAARVSHESVLVFIKGGGSDA